MLNSLQILVNSPAGIVTIELYSVSGIPNDSASNYNKFKLNSDILSYLLDSKMNFNVVGSSSADNVIISSFPAHFKILAKCSMLSPKVYGRSQRYDENPDS